MPLFKCKIIDKDNIKQTVIREAQDELTLRADMKRDGFYLSRVTQIREKKKSLLFAVSSKVKHNEVINFLRQFAVMVKSGIPISDCISSLRTQKFSPAFQKVLQELHFDIESGVLLSEAFAKHPKVFPKFFVNMVAIGEASGSLDTVLSSMATYYENDRRIRRKAKSAMVYPSILLVMIFVITLFINLFVLPRFESIINELGGEVPQITRIVMGISRFLQDYIFIIIPVLTVLIFGIVMFFMKTKKGRYIADVLVLKIPIIKNIQLNLITARFAKAFVILLSSGMGMVECLENLRKMLGNQVFYNKFGYTIEEVKRGRPLATSMSDTKMFPDMLTQMIRVGEESGDIEEVLSSTGAFFDESVEASIAKATAALEPIIIVILGIVVAVVIISVLIPMFSLMNSI